MVLQIHNEFPELDPYKNVIRRIIIWIGTELNLNFESLDLIFCTDQKLRKMHTLYLNDDRFTDVITFNLGNEDNIEAEIYISLKRAKAQAREYKVSLICEIARLIIHACLHLAGYKDGEKKQRHIMKEIEDQYVETVERLLLIKLDVEQK